MLQETARMLTIRWFQSFTAVLRNQGNLSLKRGHRILMLAFIDQKDNKQGTMLVCLQYFHKLTCAGDCYRGSTFRRCPKVRTTMYLGFHFYNIQIARILHKIRNGLPRHIFAEHLNVNSYLSSTMLTHWPHTTGYLGRIYGFTCYDSSSLWPPRWTIGSDQYIQSCTQALFRCCRSALRARWAVRDNMILPFPTDR